MGETSDVPNPSNPEFRFGGELETHTWYYPFAGLTSLPQPQGILDPRNQEFAPLPDAIDIEEKPELNWNFTFLGIPGKIVPGSDDVDSFHLGDLERIDQPLGEVQDVKWHKLVIGPDGVKRIELKDFPVTVRFEFDLPREDLDRQKLSSYYMEFQFGDVSYYFNCDGGGPTEERNISRSYDLEDENGDNRIVLIPYSLAAWKQVRIRLLNWDEEEAVDSIEIDPSGIKKPIPTKEKVFIKV